MLSVMLSFRSSSDHGYGGYDDEDDDDSEPPPLEDISPMKTTTTGSDKESSKQRDWMVFDPIVGVVPSDVKEVWIQEEQERQELFERLVYMQKIKSTPPVRYTDHLDVSSASEKSSSGKIECEEPRIRIRTRSLSTDLTPSTAATTTGSASNSGKGEVHESGNRKRGQSESLEDLLKPFPNKEVDDNPTVSSASNTASNVTPNNSGVKKRNNKKK